MRSELEQYQNSIKEFNEHTRLEFENFIQTNGSDRNKLQLRCTPFTEKKGGYGSFDLDFGLSVYRHQQSKLDELQKRVDKAIRFLVESELYQSEPNIDLAVQALKGGEA